MAKKRGQNEGSIRKRKDGTWEARVTIGVTADGRQNRKSLYGKTRQEAAAKMTDLLNSLQKGIITDTTEMTVGEWLDYYMDEYKKRFVKPTTYINYTAKVENHIKPLIGHYKLKVLRQDIVQTFVNRLTDKGLSPSTVTDVYKLLRNALETAVDDGLLVRNAANRVKLPKAPKPKINAFTAEQQNAFVEQAKVTYMGNMYIFDLCTGMRLGELLGLKWENVDFVTGELHIMQTICKVKDPGHAGEHWHLEFGTPKTDASARTIPLNETAVKVLADVRKQQEKNKIKAGAAYEDNGLIFCTQLGRPLDPTNMRRTFYTICEKSGIRGFHPHCLRHTFATRGAENNIDIRVMQRLLGHATIQETNDTYTHVSGGLKRSEISKLDHVVDY